MTDPVSVGELARQIQDVLIRFQRLAERLDHVYVSKDVFSLSQKVVDQTLKVLDETIKNSASYKDIQALREEKASKTQIENLDSRVKSLADKATVENIDSRIKSLADKATVENIDARVKSLEDNQKWVTRVVLTLIIVAVVSTVLITGARGG